MPVMGVCMFDLVNQTSLPNNINNNIMLTEIPLDNPDAVEIIDAIPAQNVSSQPESKVDEEPTTSSTSSQEPATFVNTITNKREKFTNTVNNNKQLITLLLIIGIILLIVYISNNCDNGTFVQTKYMSPQSGVINLF